MPLAHVLLGLVAAVLLPVLVCGGIVVWHAVDGRREAADAALRGTVGGLALAVDREIGRHLATATALAGSSALDLDPPDLERFEREARRSAAVLGQPVVLMDLEQDRRLVHTARPQGQVTDRPITPAFRGIAAGGRPVITDLAVGATAGRPVVGIGVPVLRDGRIRYAVGARLEPEQLHLLLRGETLPPNSFAAVADARRVIVARSDELHAATLGRAVPDANVRLFEGRAEGMYRGVALEGIERIFAFRTIAGAPGWVVFVGQDAKTYDAAWQRPLVALALGSIVAILLAALLAALVTRRILRPLRQLERIAREFGAGPPPMPRFTASVSEIDVLRQGFVDAANSAAGREAQLAEGEARLRLALDSAQIGVWELDPAASAVRLDSRARDLLCLPGEAGVWVPTGSPGLAGWIASIEPADAADCEAAFQAAMRNRGDLVEIEHRLRCEDGGRIASVAHRALRAAAHGVTDAAPRAIGNGGRDRKLRAADNGRTDALRLAGATTRPARLIGVVRDVTAQRSYETELEQAVADRTLALQQSEQRLAEAARMEALGRLAGGMAHDFNNVLQAAQGGIRLAARRLADDPGGAQRLLGLAGDALERGAAVTQRLLAFARRDELAVGTVDLSAMLHGLVPLLRSALGTGVSLEVAVDPATPPVLVDPDQLESVVVNLVNNARDALPGGTGSIALRAAPQADDPATADNASGQRPMVRLSVRDNGHGMTPEVLRRVTEPFFTTKPRGQGTGLGLSMARGFAEQSGGTLVIDSAPGRGTEVALLLQAAPPGARPAPKETRPEASAPLRTLPRTVLLVEDEPLVRAVMAEGLAERGHRVIEASDPEAALARLEEEPAIDVLVTDLAMQGGMSGLSLIGEARRRRPGLPSLVVTGDAGDAGPVALRPTIAGGPVALLRKPVGTAALEHAFEDLLDRTPGSS